MAGLHKSKPLSRQRSGLPERFRSALILLAFVSLMAGSGWLWRWDQQIYDLQLDLLSGEPSDDIVIVAVDKPSLDAIGRWPWSREVHARLVEQLTSAGAKAIVLDSLFSEPYQSDPESDIHLIQAVAASDRVFMPVILEQQRLGGVLIESMPDLANVAAGLGHVQMDLDADGIARGIYLHEGLEDAYWPHLMLSLQQWLELGVVERMPPPLTSQAHNVPLINRRNHRLIPFTGPVGSYPRYSYSQVLEGVYKPDLFQDRIVLVGITAAGLGNAFPTPVSGHDVPMPVVEINANILDSLRQGSAIHQVSFLPHLLFSGLLAAIPLLLYGYSPPRFAPLVSLSVLLLFLLLDWVMLRGMHQWFPPTAVIIGIVISYPLWSWRRLNQALRYLNQQLERMQQEQRLISVQQPRADFAHAIDFLNQLMPLKGWALYDSDRLIESHGEALGEPLQSLEPGRWQRTGAELWNQLPRGDSIWQLGLIWPRNQVPEGRSMQLLEDIAQLFSVEPDASRGTVLERVELRMHQIQEENLRLHRFRHLVANAVGQMDDGLMVINSLGQVVMSNPRAAFYLGREEEELSGQDAGQLLGVLEIHKIKSWQEVFQRVLLSGEAIRFEALRAPDTELFIQAKPLDVVEAGMQGMVINLSYIGALKHSERTRAKMLNFLSHDIRSPITSLLSLTQSHRLREGTAAEMAEQVEPLARRSLRLADNFLQLARAEAADTNAFEDTDLVSVAHNALDEVFVQAKAKEVTLRRELPEDVIWLRGDLGLLERALFNLLENAIKFSPAGGEVVMRLSREGDQVLCEIEDQGPGIPADQLREIFLPFTRAETENTSQGRGVGLGLSFVKVVADKHHGSVEAVNRAEGGALFSLRLPCEVNIRGMDGMNT
jgi:CHASE2 domain-containing sensor protein/signal transduction histidine kinase